MGRWNAIIASSKKHHSTGGGGGGTTITAASLSASDVQAAMNSAQAGDTVQLPAGTGHWTSPVSWNAPAGVTLKGAGSLSTTGGGDTTVILDDYAANALVLGISVNASGVFRMAGLTIQAGVGTAKDSGMALISGPGTIRLDHIHLVTSGINNRPPLTIGQGIIGVMDHAILDLESVSTIFVANGHDSQGNTDWAASSGFGTNNFFFIEDSIINGTAGTHDTRVTDCFTGGRYVVRFNTLTACTMGEDHATGHAGDDRGARSHEIYGNLAAQAVGQTEPNFDMIDIGSGTAMIWGNSAVQVFKNVVHFNVTRKNGDTYPSIPATPNGWGYAGTDYNGTGSAWDGNTDATNGYPCIDMPGRGQGDLLTGSFPSKINSTTGTIHWPNQVLEPIYIWSNNASVAPGWGTSGLISNQSFGRVVADRDYYLQASGIQTNATTPFNGTTGCGWGTLANRPTTCTTGVGYFATDQGSWNQSSSNPYGVQQNGADGVLYIATATNTWSVAYTPYAYPHPLNT